MRVAPWRGPDNIPKLTNKHQKNVRQQRNTWKKNKVVFKNLERIREKEESILFPFASWRLQFLARFNQTTQNAKKLDSIEVYARHRTMSQRYGVIKTG